MPWGTYTPREIPIPNTCLQDFHPAHKVYIAPYTTNTVTHYGVPPRVSLVGYLCSRLPRNHGGITHVGTQVPPGRLVIPE